MAGGLRNALVVVAALLTALTGPAAIPRASVPEYTPHAPIKIEGNEEFTPENGVVAGSGTADDPYVISGWDIFARQGQDGIIIRSVTAHFVVERNRIRHDQTFGIGICLEDAGIGGVIRKNIIANNSHGIAIVDSLPLVQANRIASNSLPGTPWGTGLLFIERTPLLKPYDGIKYNSFVGNKPWALFHFHLPLPYSYPIDASENYWGWPLPPTAAIPFGDTVIPLGPPADNYVTPNIITVPWWLEDPDGRGP